MGPIRLPHNTKQYLMFYIQCIRWNSKSTPVKHTYPFPKSSERECCCHTKRDPHTTTVEKKRWEKKNLSSGIHLIGYRSVVILSRCAFTSNHMGNIFQIHPHNTKAIVRIPDSVSAAILCPESCCVCEYDHSSPKCLRDSEPLCRWTKKGWKRDLECNSERWNFVHLN